MKQVLSLQSHVVYGHVGNAAAVFPLQRLGIEAWQLPTVLYSNHKGYGQFGGDAVPLDLMRSIRDSLLDQGRFATCDAILSGYLGNAALAGFVAETISLARQQNPDLVYICDPVMGDIGKGMYVPDELLPVFRQDLLPLANIVIPNLFETGLLTGLDIQDDTTCQQAIQSLQVLGPETAVITSLPFYGTGRIGMMAASPDQVLAIHTPYIPLDFTPGGAGDTTAALFTAHWLLSSGKLRDSLEQTACGIHHIFSETARLGGSELAIVSGGNALPTLTPVDHAWNLAT